MTNEATLTGESTPQMKDALDAAEDRALAYEAADRVAAKAEAARRVAVRGGVESARLSVVEHAAFLELFAAEE